ncbi:hypothetical protein TNCV_656001 [Trichonephila clavipes]|nr:hypothetical protein TNCV_656001 [Trichonephila clavipes]
MLSHGNEVADFLAKRACSEISTADYALTYREIYSLMKIKDKQVLMVPPDHPGCSRKSPGLPLDPEGLDTTIDNRAHLIERLFASHTPPTPAKRQPTRHYRVFYSKKDANRKKIGKKHGSDVIIAD